MAFRRRTKVIIDPDGGIHTNATVVRFSNTLTAAYAPFLLSVSAILGAVAMYFVYEQLSFESRAIKAQATVVRIESKETTSHSNTRRGTRTTHTTMYRKILSYRDATGRSHEIAESSWSNTRPTEGEQSAVLIDPSDPEKAMSNTVIERFLIPALLGIFSFLGTIFGILPLIFNMKKQSLLHVNGKTWENDTGAPIHPRAEIRTSVSLGQGDERKGCP